MAFRFGGIQHGSRHETEGQDELNIDVLCRELFSFINASIIVQSSRRGSSGSSFASFSV